MGPLLDILGLLGDESMEVVVVGTGPGSYNGARVGIAAAQGVGVVHGCPAVGISSLEARPSVRSGSPCLALGEARRETFFTAPLRDGRLSAAPILSEHPQFKERVREAVEHEIALVSLDPPSRLRLPEYEILTELPTAPLLLEAWTGRSAEERRELESLPPQPFYLREPYITLPREGPDTGANRFREQEKG